MRAPAISLSDSIIALNAAVDAGHSALAGGVPGADGASPGRTLLLALGSVVQALVRVTDQTLIVLRLPTRSAESEEAVMRALAACKGWKATIEGLQHFMLTADEHHESVVRAVIRDALETFECPRGVVDFIAGHSIHPAAAMLN